MRSIKPFTKNVKRKRSLTGNGFHNQLMEDDCLSHSAISAYHKAQVRGLQPKHKLDDWYAAEEEEKY